LPPWESPEDVVDCLQASSSSAALGAALELGLPWLLETGPRDVTAVGRVLGIPPDRCRWWLEVLVAAGLLCRAADGYALTAEARRVVIGTYGRESWAFLAREERERLPSLLETAARLTRPAVPPDPDPVPETYVEQMAADPKRARGFTRMLYDLHRDLAARFADVLDVGGARSLLDLGGGSGVMSLALLDRYPSLTAVVMDIATVCAEGRLIAAERGLGDRISFVEGDLLTSGFPAGLDLVLECDVGLYPEGLLSRVRDALQPGGRLVVVDLMGESEEEPPTRVLHWGFAASLIGPGWVPMTWSRLRREVQRCGFRLGAERDLGEGYRLLEALP
jgi:SAM-dependent methyltransferase